MVFGGSVMGTLLCSSHIAHRPSPNSTHTPNTYHQQPTLSHNTSQQSTNGASAHRRAGEPQQYIDGVGRHNLQPKHPPTTHKRSRLPHRWTTHPPNHT